MENGLVGSKSKAERTEKSLEQSRQEAKISWTVEVAVKMERRVQILWERFLGGRNNDLFRGVRKVKKNKENFKLSALGNWMDGGSVYWYLIMSSSLLRESNDLILFKFYVAFDVSNLWDYFLQASMLLNFLSYCYASLTPFPPATPKL